MKQKNANMKARIAVVAAILLLVCIITPSSAWLSGYGARQKHNITGSSYWGGNLTNYAVPLTVQYGAGVSSGDTIYLNSLSQTDFDDIRFTDLSDTEFDYWLEDKVDSSVAHVWVEIPDIGDTETTQIYVYYGNSGASSASNGENAFEFFDHFDDPASSLNTTLWYSVGTGGIDIDSSIANLSYTTSYSFIRSVEQFPINYSTRFNAKTNTAVTGNMGNGGRTDAAGSKIALWFSAGPAANTRDLYVYETGAEHRYTLEDGNYHDIDLHRNHTTSDVLWSDGVYKNSSITQVLSGNANVSFGSGTTAGGYCYSDWIFVRKYNYPEPVHSTWFTAETNAPTSSFSGTPLVGMDTLNVQFTDSSTNTPTSWYWDFGDGDTDTVQNPLHNYVSPGIYTVCLNATNAWGSDWENKTDYITVWESGGGTGLPTTSYLYNITLTITGSDKQLLNYEVPINIERSSGISSGNTMYVGTSVQNDYSDIKFFQDGYCLDYWIEQQTVSCATAWIQVPYIKESTDGLSYVYALFGNSTDSYTGNGTETFMFFDDFETGQLFNSTGGKWTFHAGECENWTINSSMVYDGSYSASGHNWGVQDNPGRQLKIEYLDYTGSSYVPVGNPEMKNVTIESRMRWTSTGSNTCHGGDLYSSVWDGLAGTSVYSPYYVMNFGNIVYHNGAYTNWPNSLGTYTTNTWHKVKLTRDFENQHQYAWIDSQYLGSVVPTLGDGTAIDDSFTVYWTGVVAASTFANPLTTDQYTYIDDFFIHQYYYPEPTYDAESPTVVADFTSNITSGPIPLNVGFTDTSTGNIISWEWDVDGDNVIEFTTQNCAYQYTIAGPYNVNLKVTDVSGNSDWENKTAYITATSGGPTPTPTPTVMPPTTSGTPAPIDWSIPGCADVNTFSETGVGTDDVTFNGNFTGAVGEPLWFRWGSALGALPFATSVQNATTSPVNFSYYIHGVPLFPGQTYYYSACSDCGCGNVESFTLLTTSETIAPIDTTNYDQFVEDVDDGFNITGMLETGTSAYTDVLGVMFYGVILMFFFGGILIRQENPYIAFILMIIGYGMVIAIVPDDWKMFVLIIGIAIAGGILYTIGFGRKHD